MKMDRTNMEVSKQRHYPLHDLCPVYQPQMDYWLRQSVLALIVSEQRKVRNSLFKLRYKISSYGSKLWYSAFPWRLVWVSLTISKRWSLQIGQLICSIRREKRLAMCKINLQQDSRVIFYIIDWFVPTGSVSSCQAASRITNDQSRDVRMCSGAKCFR